jgi:steroid 5-alpha reductase family enzyme
VVANRSCFFLDTAARSDKGPYWARDNAFRAALKAVLLLGSLLFTWVLLFAEGVSPPVVGYDDKRRRSAALTGCAMFAVRLLWQMGWLWHRRITWAEVFAEAGMIIPASLGSLAWGATRKRSDSFGALDVLGCAVFLVGTAVNIISEHQRYVFKAEARNAGKLFAKGLWRLARHINYGGEILSFVGMAMVCGTWNLWIPLCMGLGMCLFSVPELDHYLAVRYGPQWDRYVRQVRWNVAPYVW